MHLTVAEEVLEQIKCLLLTRIGGCKPDCVCVLYRQETCPCCRKPVNPSLIFVMFKLSKSIGRMKIKVGNGNKEMVLLFLVIASDVAASWVTLALV